MSPTGLRVPVDAPRPSPPRQSLLTAAQALGRVVDGTLNTATAVEEQSEQDDAATSSGRGGPDWVRGLTYEPLGCRTTAEMYDPICASDDPPDTGVDQTAATSHDPLMAEVGVFCSTMGLDRAKLEAEAVDLLGVVQHDQVGGEFWRGDAAQAATPDLANRYLADTNAVNLGTGVAVRDALAALESALAGLGDEGCGVGQRSMIHAPPQIVVLWESVDLLRHEGGLILTPLDNIVVTGPGYDGSPPVDVDGGAQLPDDTGATAWVYGTGLADVRLGPVIRRSHTDRDHNTVTVVASRPVAVTWDGCCQVAVEVDATDRT